MVDQLVVLVGAAGQHHRVAVFGVAAVQHRLPGGLQLVGEAGLGCVAGGDGLPGELGADAKGGGHVVGQLAVPVGVVVPVEQRRVEGDAPAALGVVRVADDDGVALDHRAHGLAGGGGAVGLDGGDGGHEDAVHLPPGQVPQVAVDQLGREADGVRSDGGQALLVQGAGALARQLDPEAQAAPEGVPERHGLPEGEDPGDADGHPAVGGQGGGVVVGEEQLFPQGKQVGDALDGLIGLADPGLDGLVAGVAQDLAPLAAVAGDKALPGGEADDRPAAVVLAEGAGLVLGLGVGEGIQRLKADEVAGRAAAGLGLALGQQSRADGAHLAGVRRTGDGAAQVLLQRPEHRVVFEGAALHHDPAAQHIGVGDAHHLGKDVFDDGAAQPRHDVVGGAAVFLFGDDAAVHKDGAAAAQLGGVLGAESRVRDALHRDAQRGGELLQEGAATRGAGLVQQHVGDHAVLDPDGFHVLAADVQQEGDVGQVVAGGRRMGHRLHRVIVPAEGFAQHHLAVAGGAKAQYFQFYAHGAVLFVQFLQAVADHLDGVAPVAGVETVQHGLVLVQQDQLAGGAAGVHPDVDPQGVAGPDVGGLEGGQGVAGPPGVPLGVRAEVALGVVLLGGGGRGRQPLQRLLGGHGGGAAGGQGIQLVHGQGRAQGHDGVGVAGADDLVLPQAQPDGVEGRQGDVRPAGPLVEQGLDVGLGKDAAPARDAVHLLAHPGQGLEGLGGHPQQGGDLVDEGAGAAGAAAVHPHIGGGQGAVLLLAEKDDLGVLAAQLHGGAGGGVEGPDGGAVGHHLLDIAGPHLVGQGPPARPADRHPHGQAGKLVPDLAQQLAEGAALLGVVALVAPEQDAAALAVGQHGLDGGGTDVEAEVYIFHDLIHCFTNLRVPSIKRKAEAFRAEQPPCGRRGGPLAARLFDIIQNTTGL